MMTPELPEVEFSKYNINVLRVVKVVFKNVNSRKRDMHDETYA